jgi:hypothetical protein
MDRWLPANLYSAGGCLSSDCAARVSARTPA